MKKIIILLFIGWHAIQATPDTTEATQALITNRWSHQILQAIRKTDLPTFQALLQSAPAAIPSPIAYNLLHAAIHSAQSVSSADVCSMRALQFIMLGSLFLLIGKDSDSDAAKVYTVTVCAIAICAALIEIIRAAHNSVIRNRAEIILSAIQQFMNNRQSQSQMNFDINITYPVAPAAASTLIQEYLNP